MLGAYLFGEVDGERSRDLAGLKRAAVCGRSGQDRRHDNPCVRPLPEPGIVALWLEGEGYAVTSLTDENQPVTVRMLKDAVTAYVASGSLDQLVVYFAGHGYLNGTSEIWLPLRGPLRSGLGRRPQLQRGTCAFLRGAERRPHIGRLPL